MEESSEEGVIGFLEFTGKTVELGAKKLVKRSVIIGRLEDAGVVIPDDFDAVSRKHAELVFGKGRWFIRDLGSKAGTFVDWKRIGSEQVPVNARHQVNLGGDSSGVEFRVKLAGKRGRPRTRPVGEKRRQLWRPGVHTITDRDLDVLRWVAEHRFSTAEILVKACFSKPAKKRLQGKAPSGVYGCVRVAKLLRDGFLTASTYRIGKTVPLLLSQKGYDVLHGQGRVEWAHLFAELDAARFEHELLIQTLRLKLEGLGVKKWRSERELSWKNRVKHLPFVPDAQFEAGGRTWNLEIERTLKSKERRKKGLTVRAKYADERFLYVVPESIWSALRESIKTNATLGFEGGIYWLSEADARQGRMTVQCRWSENLPWTDSMPLDKLLRGGFEPALATRRYNIAVATACEEMRKEFSNLAYSVQSHISSALAMMQSYNTKLANRRKGVMGIGAEKIEPTKFSSCGELAKRFSLMTAARRKWRASHAIELEGFKRLESAFEAYAGQLIVTEEAIAKSIADRQPKGYSLPSADALEQALGVLSGR